MAEPLPADVTCAKETSGTCLNHFLQCEDWRNAICRSGRCVCRSSDCSVGGQCVPRTPNWRPRQPSSLPLDPAGQAPPVTGANFTALVLSGGGSKGAFELGILEGICANKSLEELRGWSMIVGTSIGALTAGALSQFPPEQQCTHAVPMVTRFWQSIRTSEDVWQSTQLGSPLRAPGPVRVQCLSALDAVSMALGFYQKGGLCDPSPGRRAYEFSVNTSRIQGSGTRLQVVATSLSTGHGRWWNETSDDIVLGILASSSLSPLIFPMEVEGEWYIDGGFVTNTPILRALELGATTVVVVDPSCFAQENLIKNVSQLEADEENVGLRIVEFEAALMQRSYFLDHELEMACAGYPDREILAYFPSRSDIVNMADFSAESIEQMRLEGQQIAREDRPRNLCKLYRQMGMQSSEAPFEASALLSTKDSGDQVRGLPALVVICLAAAAFSGYAWYLGIPCPESRCRRLWLGSRWQDPEDPLAGPFLT